VSASLDRTVRLWKVARGQDLLVLEGHTRPVRALAFSHDGAILAACADDPGGGIEVIVWRADHRPVSTSASDEPRARSPSRATQRDCTRD
jgi:WD40 repeat protein